jgi:hypothetical protein
MFWPSIAGMGTSFEGIRTAVRISRNLRRFFGIIFQKLSNAGSSRGWQRTFLRIPRSGVSPIPTGRKHRVCKGESVAGSMRGAFVLTPLVLSPQCQQSQSTEPQSPEIRSFEAGAARKGLSPVSPAVPGTTRSSLISQVRAVSRKTVSACPKTAPRFPNVWEDSRRIASAPPMTLVSGVKCLNAARKPTCPWRSVGAASSTKQ